MLEHEHPTGAKALIPLLITVLLLSVVAFSPREALAEPTTAEQLASKRAEAARIKARLDDLQRDVELSGEALLDLQDQISVTKGEISETEERISITQEELASSREALAARVASTYRSGDTSFLNVLVGSGSFEDFVSRFHYVQTIQERDAQMIDYNKSLKEQLAAQESSLQQRLEEQQELEAQAKTKHDELDSALGEQEEILGSISSEISGLIAQQRAEEEARARAEALARQAAAEEEARQAAAAAAQQTQEQPAQQNEAPASPESPSAPAAPASPAPSQPERPTTPSAPAETPAPEAPAAPAAPAPTPTQPEPAPAPKPEPKPEPAPSNKKGTPRPHIVDLARKHIGKPYLWAATGPDSFDCSGLTMTVYREAGFSIPRTSYNQYSYVKNKGNLVTDVSRLVPGDLVFFGKRGVHHVGIWVGGGQYLHAPRKGDHVRIQYMPLGDFAGGGSV